MHLSVTFDLFSHWLVCCLSLTPLVDCWVCSSQGCLGILLGWCSNESQPRITKKHLFSIGEVTMPFMYVRWVNTIDVTPSTKCFKQFELTTLLLNIHRIINICHKWHPSYSTFHRLKGKIDTKVINIMQGFGITGDVTVFWPIWKSRNKTFIKGSLNWH